MQLYREQKKKKHSNRQYSQLKNNIKSFFFLIVLTEEILLRVRFGTHKDNMALLQSIKGESILVFSFPFPSPSPSEDILIVNALERRAKHS